MPIVHFAATRKVGNFLFGFRVRIQSHTTHGVKPVHALSLARQLASLAMFTAIRRA
jgi:hypothetical protein